MTRGRRAVSTSGVFPADIANVVSLRQQLQRWPTVWANRVRAGEEQPIDGCGAQILERLSLAASTISLELTFDWQCTRTLQSSLINPYCIERQMKYLILCLFRPVMSLNEELQGLGGTDSARPRAGGVERQPSSRRATFERR